VPLDPQVRRYLDQQAALASPPQREVPPAIQRLNQRAARVLTVTEQDIPGPGGSIPVRIFRPAGPTPWPLLVYFHGGGWVIGDLDTTDLRCRVLADWGRCVVVSVYYRHAPEHRFPAAIDDAYAGTLWAAEHATELGADAERLAVCGDSAGGNLAAAVTLLAREGGPRIMFQNLVYPVVDHDFSRASYVQNASGFGLSQDTMRWYWDQYVPDESARDNPLASPLRADDLSGLPPAFIQSAEFDPLRDEGEAYAERLQAAGVPVILKRYDGVIHGFIGQAGEFDIGKRAVLDAATALRSAFAEAASPR
jgi:acetyl esterase/lipase